MTALSPDPIPAPVARPAAEVLVVDDAPMNRALLKRQLEKHGHAITLACDGREALDLIEARPFDLILLDLLMPEIEGEEVLRRLKADARQRDVPVIVISAVEEMDTVIRCIEGGAEDYLAKPFDPVLLKARVHACLEKKRLHDAQMAHAAELEATLRTLKTTQEQLVQQEKMASLGALTAGIAHEIKNPLNFVNNFATLSVDLLDELAGLLSGDAVPAAKAADVADVVDNLKTNLSKIREHGKRADGIVAGMLLHSRNQPGERAPADLNVMLRENANLAYHGLRGLDTAFNVGFEYDLDPAVGDVRVIRQDLGRVFLNLVNNACYAANLKIASAGANFRPTVRITSKRLGNRVEVRVRDNGPGVPPAIREKIFNPFFTTKPTGAGTGLGLSISFDIVVQGHQGELRLDTKEGEYAEFIVVLPG